MLKTDEYKEYVELDTKKKELERDLEKTKKKIAQKQEALIENLIDNEMKKISIAGKTVYIHNMTYASIKDRARAIEELKKAGYDDYVKEGVNNNSISALLRHFQEEGEDLPENFKGVIDPYEKISLRVINET